MPWAPRAGLPGRYHWRAYQAEAARSRGRCLSLTSGPGGKHYADRVVTCPWHNSTFVVRTGENLDWTAGIAGRSIPRWSRRVIAVGRRPAPLTTYPVSIEGDEVFIEI